MVSSITITSVSSSQVAWGQILALCPCQLCDVWAEFLNPSDSPVPVDSAEELQGLSHGAGLKIHSDGSYGKPWTTNLQVNWTVSRTCVSSLLQECDRFVAHLHCVSEQRLGSVQD